MDALPDELVDYLAVCQSGRFYEALGELWGIDATAPRRRGSVKKLAFRLVLFGPTRHEDWRWQGFRDRWPTMARFLEAAKEPDHGIPARAGQRLESALMIETICDRLRREHPDVPVVTIHDCLMTIQAHVGTVQAVILEEFGRLGIEPTVKRKNLPQAGPTHPAFSLQAGG